VSRLVTIGWFTEPWDAHLVRGRLQAEDVFVCIVHEHHVWANWMYSNVLGQVKLQVLEEDAERGAKVLRRCRRGDFEKDLEHEFGALPKEQCPACRSTEIRQRTSVSRALLAFAVLGALGVAYPPRKNVFRCGGCGREWRTSKNGP
jgi:hypothetical protein